MKALATPSSGVGNEEGTEQRRLGEDRVSTVEKMQMWQDSFKDPEHQIEPYPYGIEDDMDLEQSETIEGFDEYVKIILEDCSYKWLLGKLRNQAFLTDDEEDNVMSSVRHEIFKVLPRTTSLRSGCAPLSQVVFEVLWPLRSFLIDNFADAEQVQIARIITITGKASDAQTMTCEQYMEQIWPCTGVHLPRLLQQLMSSHSMTKHRCQRPDGAILEAWEVGPATVHVSIIGTSGVIAEVAEQLSWLSAALRAAPESKRLATSKPSIHCVTIPDERSLPTIEEKVQYEQTDEPRKGHDHSGTEELLGATRQPYHFRIMTDLRDVDYVSARGLCWYQMLQQSVMVRGFPIRRRQQKDLGLEISLKVAAELVGTMYLNSFAGQLFVKGYSAMLIPTLQVGDLLVWHSYFSPLGQHLPYRYRDAGSVQGIKMDDIGNFRHVIGWCSHALNHAGVADSDYTVRRARLPKAIAGCMLVDSNISFAIPLTSTDSPILSKQYYTPHARRTGYPSWFRYLSQKFVLFWDKRDQRGWLVNGIRALLHLIRASLRDDERNSAGSDFILKSSDLKEPKQPHSVKAPREFLSQRDNLCAKLALSKIGADSAHDMYETLDDRMEQYYYVLEKATKYSEILQESSAETLKGKSAFRLEGWDFVDLVERAEAIDARTTILPNVSHDWLELIRSVGVTVFFGQGFGELIRPLNSNCCEAWRTLPVGKHYIAVNVADIQRIMELKGNPDSTPRYLTETLLWHHPATAFKHCGCQKLEGMSTKLIQQPCPARKTCVCSELKYTDLEMNDYETGAIIFGHNPEHGPLPEIETDDEFEDSGIGSTLTESTSRSSILVPQPTQHDSVVRQYGDGTVSGGKAHFGDNVHYTINNYASLLHSTHQPGAPDRHSENLHPRMQELSGTKRSHSCNEPTLALRLETQPDHAESSGSSGPSKRVKKEKGPHRSR